MNPWDILEWALALSMAGILAAASIFVITGFLLICWHEVTSKRGQQ